MTIKNCPQCNQDLRFPDHIGGMLMACPVCGQKFHSDFKLANPAPQKPAGATNTDQSPEEPPKRPEGFSVVA